LSLRLPDLTFPPYAEAHCTQQNAQSSGETLQDHCPWKGLEVAFLATPSVVDEKRKTQTPTWQSSARRQHRRGASEGESSFRLRRERKSGAAISVAALCVRIVVVVLMVVTPYLAGPFPTNQAQVQGCKDCGD
jgi:hypothetical protein